MRWFHLLTSAGIAAASYGNSTTPKVANVVSFGDSYTDEGRLSAYAANGGKTPPVATNTTGSNSTAGGGYGWGHTATQLLGATYYDYAVSGAFCSNEIFSRYLSAINRTFPSVIDDEIPSFIQDVNYVNASTGSNTFFTDRTASNTVYALWIGTNDLGINAFLTDSQHVNYTITDYVNCIWQVFDSIYSVGGRRFVLLNTAPLQYTPLYAATEHGGTGDNEYWTNKTSYNTTEYEQKIREYTTNVNTIFDYGVPFQSKIARRWPHAEFTIFDVHQLILDIRDAPENYLEAPTNITGYYNECDVTGTNCTLSSEPLDSFLWYDALHPSARVDEIIGTEFSKLVYGNSSYGIYW